MFWTIALGVAAGIVLGYLILVNLRAIFWIVGLLVGGGEPLALLSRLIVYQTKSMRGGRRLGAGRPAGAKNKRTAAREAAMASARQTIEANMPDAFQGDAHAFLTAVYKDPLNDISLRMDAAKAAIRFERPALAAVDAEVLQRIHATVEEKRTIDPRSMTPLQRQLMKQWLASMRAGDDDAVEAET